MKSKNTGILFVALAIDSRAVALVGLDSVTLSVAPSALHALDTGGILKGRRKYWHVINRNGDAFTIRDSNGKETVIVATDKPVKEVRRACFALDRTSNASEIRRGLRLAAEGRGVTVMWLVARSFASMNRI